ncbi:MAG TPA: RidA family protein [Gammaproteobacteria bacterium]
MSRVDSILAGMGLALPPPKAPVANYLGTKRSGNLLFVSGRVSEKRGQVDAEVSEQEAKLAARDTVLDLLAIIKADIDDLDDIVSIVKLQGFVNSSMSFNAQPKVIDGASELLIALYGEAGKHARTATGAAQLPYGASIQLDMVVELADKKIQKPDRHGNESFTR